MQKVKRIRTEEDWQGFLQKKERGGGTGNGGNHIIGSVRTLSTGTGPLGAVGLTTWNGTSKVYPKAGVIRVRAHGKVFKRGDVRGRNSRGGTKWRGTWRWQTAAGAIGNTGGKGGGETGPREMGGRRHGRKGKEGKNWMRGKTYF